MTKKTHTQAFANLVSSIIFIVFGAWALMQTYGFQEVRNTYVLIHGSVPGPTKRLIRFRDATRLPKGAATEAVDVTYVSTESKQGA